MYDPNHYRGVHITSILSKVAERIIGGPLLRFFETANCYGKHQWAYRKHRSSSDLITLLVCSWLFSFCSGNCIGAFLSDISGAFDRVFTPFMLARLCAHGIGRKYLKFLQSYLEKRSGFCVHWWRSILPDRLGKSSVPRHSYGTSFVERLFRRCHFLHHCTQYWQSFWQRFECLLIIRTKCAQRHNFRKIERVSGPCAQMGRD